MKVIGVVWTCLIVLLVAELAVAGTIHVDDDGVIAPWDGTQEHPFQYIQDGIDAAVNGDTVLVADGIYVGDGNKDLDFRGKAITVTSENGVESTIIDCEETGRGFYFHSGETPESVVTGFTIKNGSPSPNEALPGCGAGVLCVNYSSPAIGNSVITANSASLRGGGIGCVNSSPVIRNNEIDGNSAREGGGIYCIASSPKIINNTINGNSAHHGGGIRCVASSSPIIENNTITENLADDGGGGIICWNSSGTIKNNKIIGNSANDGGGIQCRDSAFSVIQNNEIKENSANDRGGGIYCHAASPTIKDNKINRNSAGYGGGINCNGLASPKIQNNRICGNSAGWGGGFLFHSSSPAINNSTIINNRAIHKGGGIYCVASATPTVLNTILSGNTPNEIDIAESAALRVSLIVTTSDRNGS